MFRDISLCILFMLSTTAAPAAEIPLPAFDIDGISGWKEKSFSGKTSYRTVNLADIPALKAESKASASGLYHERRIDLHKTPWLNWQWRIENRLPPADEKSKAGDDYSARIYVVIDGGLILWKTLALSYTWSSNAARGDTWDNAFAGSNVKMLALRTRDDAISRWYTEKRNVYEDLKKQFGKTIGYIDAVAVMTDTDNSGGQAVAYYADIFFSQQ
jgi:hypothetical protein